MSDVWSKARRKQFFVANVVLANLNFLAMHARCTVHLKIGSWSPREEIEIICSRTGKNYKNLWESTTPQL